MRNSLTFGGVNSADYGVYITGKGIHDAPKRVVEEVVIPGRNGTLAMDMGRYENIQVTYPAFAFGKNRKEFQEKIDAFRNVLAAQIGYQRLADTYRPDEYRMGLFNEGVEVEVGPYGCSGKFELRFGCKPQRYLTDGEVQIRMESAEQTVVNPTEHKSEPLIAAEGYGTIGVNGQNIVLRNEQVGYVQFYGETFFQNGDELPCDLDLVGSSDYIDITGMKLTMKWVKNGDSVTNISFSGLDSRITTLPIIAGGRQGLIYLIFDTLSLQKTGRLQNSFTVTLENPRTQQECQGYLDIRFSNGAFTVWLEVQADNARFEASTFRLEEMTCTSTETVLGHPTYIDCEVGEAYKIKDGKYVSLDGYIELGSNPPKLTPGDNTITYTENITQLDVTPRWWRI